MSGLRELQTAFQAALRRPDDSPAIAGCLSGRFEVYRNAYQLRLLEALVDAFEKTALYLGADFEHAARAYIAAHPPRARNLRWYGEAFPDWLALRYPQDADVLELARLDWLLRRAFDAANSQCISIETLAALPDTASRRLQLVASAALLPVTSNAAAIWHAIDSERMPPGAATLDRATGILVWRIGEQPHFRTLEPSEFCCLQQVFAGRSLAAICEACAEAEQDDFAQAFAVYLRRWFDDGLIAAVT